MKKLHDATIEYNTSTYHVYGDCIKHDWVDEYDDDVTISELFDDAYSEIEQSTFGIARIYQGIYQLGTVTKGNNGMNTFYTNYGRKLNGYKDY